MKRVLMLFAGTLGGLVLVEGGLQVARLVFQGIDARRQAHVDAEDGGDLRVLCLGACYTVGVGTPADQSYPAQLERLLDSQLASVGGDAVVLNRGVRGKSIDYFAARIEPLVEAHRPDVVVLGVNRKMGLDVAPAPEETARVDGLLLPEIVGLVVASEPVEPVAREREAARRGIRTADTEQLQEDGSDDYLATQIAALEAVVDSRPESRRAYRKLTNLHVARGDFDAARTTFERTLSPGPLALEARLVLFRHALALGDYAVAEEHLAVLQAAPDFVARHAAELPARKQTYAQRGQDVHVWDAIDRGRLALLRGDVDAARRLLERAIKLDPDSADAHQTLLFLAARRGEELPGPAVATLERPRVIVSPAGFEAALDAHLARVQNALVASGAQVIVHNLGALPEQTPVIERLAEARGMMFVDVMGALAAESTPDRFFHPTNHLRLSRAGNAWLADQIWTVMTPTVEQLESGRSP